MYKKLIGLIISGAMIALLASCSCSGSNTLETAPHKTVEITPELEAFHYVNFVTNTTWLNQKTGDTIFFANSGSFDGKIDGEKYEGTYTLRQDKDKVGRVIAGVTLKGEEKEVDYFIDFKTSSKMTLTTDKGASETYVTDWSLDEDK